ncbi:putative transcription factor B3-Domain family [Helianthus anomalus]
MMLFRVMLDNGDVFVLNFHRDTKIPPKENLNLHKFGAKLDPTKIPPSFLTSIGDEPVFFGDKVPYVKTVKIRDGNSLRCVRIRKRNGEPIFTDGWIMLVRENDLKYKDGVLITATGPYTFNVLCFKEFVCQNSYFTAQINDVPYMTLMPDKFWNNFYDKTTRMDGLNWLRMCEPYLVFTMIDLKTFELSVFDPESGTEIVFKKDNVDKGKCEIDTDEVLVTKNENLVKGKSKVDDAQTQRNVRSRVKRVDAAAITSSPVLKSTDLTQRNLRSSVKRVEAATITGSPVLKSIDLVENQIVSFFKFFYWLHSSYILIT